MGQGAYILGCSGLHLTAGEAAFFREAQPWGFILFARNIDTPEQVRQLTADLRNAVQRDVPVLIDQEGGRVQRLRAPLWREWRPPMDQVRLAGPAAPRAMWLRYALIGQELRALGIDGNCAPTADVANEQTHPFLFNRCYGTEPEAVATIALAVAESLTAAGILPVMKHMPGHGRALADSHLNLPRVDAGASALRKTDFAPFAALAHLPAAMTAHVVYSAFDEAPATTSTVMVDIMREEIGFDGLLMTDDISMNALQGDLAHRARASLDAGCDLVLHCNGDLGEMHVVAEVCQTLSVDAARRAERAAAARGSAGNIDIAAIEAEFRALEKGGASV